METTTVAETPSLHGSILFADDDALFREGLGKRLVKAGFACAYAGTTAEAVALLRGGTFDVLLSDINMPGNAGLELIESLPGIMEGLPVVLLTGRPTMETATRSVRLRVAAYLTKPPDFEELCAVLKAAALEARGLRLLKEQRHRLQDWDRELERMQRLLRQTPAEQRHSTMHGYVRLTLRNLIVGLVELENLLIQDGEQLGTAQALEKQELLNAVRKTVNVLAKTKDHFKSKDLGQLRKELEELIG